MELPGKGQGSPGGHSDHFQTGRFDLIFFYLIWPIEIGIPDCRNSLRGLCNLSFLRRKPSGVRHLQRPSAGEGRVGGYDHRQLGRSAMACPKGGSKGRIQKRGKKKSACSRVGRVSSYWAPPILIGVLCRGRPKKQEGRTNELERHRKETKKDQKGAAEGEGVPLKKWD